MHTETPLVVVGGGIGGLAAALACARQGWRLDVLEQAAAFGEVGAGIQLGPNAVRVLQGWGLGGALERVAAFAPRLEVRSALSGSLLARLPLGPSAVQRYGAPYATLARADLHSLLLEAVQSTGRVALHLNTQVLDIAQDAQGVTLHSAQHARTEHDNTTPTTPTRHHAPLVIGADGLWSRVRAQLLHDGPPRSTGHWAYRSLVAQRSLPAALRTTAITAWLGPRFHAVQYPVRGGEWLNVVVVMREPSGAPSDAPPHWNHSANTDWQAPLRHAAAPLQALVQAMPTWRRWMLCDRPALRSAAEQAQGRIALLGDAAHPMRPYLAQGAGMALEDAAALAYCLGPGAGKPPPDIAQALQRYAQARWQRNARVQARAERNGALFHWQGPLRWARNAALRTLGPRLLDMPWLYGYRAPQVEA